jgi:hypothetical protein
MAVYASDGDNRRKLNSYTIELLYGEIGQLCQRAAAVVSPDDTDLSGGWGSGRVIRSLASTPGLQSEIAHLCGHPNPSQIKLGRVVSTGAGKLGIQRIIHAVVFDQAGQLHAEVLKGVIEKSLNLCLRDGLISVAIPLPTSSSPQTLFRRIGAFVDGLVAGAQATPSHRLTVILISNDHSTQTQAAILLDQAAQASKGQHEDYQEALRLLESHAPDVSRQLATVAGASAPPTPAFLADTIYRLISAADDLIATPMLDARQISGRRSASASVIGLAIGIDSSLILPVKSAADEAKRIADRTMEVNHDEYLFTLLPQLRSRLDALILSLLPLLRRKAGIADPSSRSIVPPIPSPTVSTEYDLIFSAVERLAASLEIIFDRTAREKLELDLRERGLQLGLSEGLKQLCHTEDPIWLIKTFCDDRAIAELRHNLGLPQETTDLDEQVRQILEQLRFSIPAYPQGIKTFVGEVEQNLARVQVAPTEHELTGLVMSSVHVYERACIDVLRFYARILFPRQKWDEALVSRDIASVKFQTGKPPLGLIVEALQKLDRFLKHCDDPHIRDIWREDLRGEITLGDLHRKAEHAVSIRNRVVHPDLNRPLDPLPLPQLLQFARELIGDSILAVLRRFDDRGIYPTIVTFFESRCDPYGRQTVTVLTSDGTKRELVARRSVEPGHTYFLIASDNPATMFPKLVERD